MFGAFYWNPPLEAFRIPFIDRPVVWYGVLFVTGFMIGYFIAYSIIKKILKTHDKTIAQHLADRLTWFVVGGTLIGARLGHVLFYDPKRYLAHPIEILQTWKGGLASHGGIIGILIALYLFYRICCKKYPELSFIRIIDVVAIPSALAAFFIRLGNFMNQEILGTPTTMPWGVVFGTPADGSFPESRHPVQLYEAFSYLFIFIFLYSLWRSFGTKLRPGMISGLLFILVFSARIVLEFWKEGQNGIMETGFLQTGQILSIPAVILGFILFFFGDRLAKGLKVG